MTIILLTCFGIGAIIRVREENRRTFLADMTHQCTTIEQQERVRIARELHDVIGYALSQITVQAGVGLHLMDRDPDQARLALMNIRDVSKSALAEARTVLGVLRDRDAPVLPQPGLAGIARLIAGVHSPDLVAVLDDQVAGQQPAQATGLAAYRIVQEALANVVRHAQAHRVTVRLERVGDQLHLTVTDDGRGVPTGQRVGYGILGMQERAELLGGSVAVFPGATGGTQITVTLPWGDGGI
ncbi:MAG: hypothetical protein B5766_10875 [Candidatus Lumbricidophila eiseniae]|uniref:histidine kinase n=1 Tax=Candidatus Lumbricidiphila eiseniae TaxID=1969409 RepID=A0A2A6FNS8_9MICO|nr:MAG: hypothetical protein B5766_10875 [Candidatus Lumbricidophila eiseniae]